MNKLKILAVDDDPDILELLEATLEDEFYIVTASTGKETFEKIEKEKPDVLILDYMLPDTTGIEICSKIRSNSLLLHLPILMLTGKSEVEDKVTGLNAGSDDYMIKPFSPPELLARVKMLIRRSAISLDANPLSRLPGNVSINKELAKRIMSKDRFAVLYLDIDNFKALNDYYGFERGDNVIKELSRVIIECVQKKGSVSDFIGHIGGDDFVIITSPDKAENIAGLVISEFDRLSPTFYDEADKIKGYIETEDRNRQKRIFPFVTISIGITTNLEREFTHTAEISSVGAELKEKAKRLPSSNYVIDQRSSD